MDQRYGFVSADKSRVLDVKPLRRLVPLFPNPTGTASVTSPQASPFVCVPPSGPFPPGVQPFYPFMVPGSAENRSGNHTPAPVPLNSFRTPISQANGSRPQPKRGSVAMEDDEFSASQGFDTDGSGKLSAREIRKRRAAENAANGNTFDFDPIVNDILSLFHITNFEEYRKSKGDTEAAGTVLFIFNLLRRKLTLLQDEIKDSGVKRPDLKVCNLLMTKGIRANNSKMIGHVSGIEVGDIFFFRMEMCLVGIHAPSMAGIDYMTVRATSEEEPIAVSIVSAGGYDDNDGDDCHMLIYTGQGGVQRRDGQMFDQKLERGNLALEKSLHRGNEVRVMRGIKDKDMPGCKIYVYDGLYKIQESWAETNKSGCNVFKYKLVRSPGQREAYSIWKSVQQWKDGTATRPDVILPDLTYGAESQPVTLVNEVDRDRPEHFTYISTLQYSRRFSSSQPFVGCHCVKGCQSGDPSCGCNQRNGSGPPYSPLAVLLSDKPVIHECGLSCKCPPTCRSRLSQGGFKVRLEVFKTRNRGWGLRSWDPIRAGGFICEYAGEAFTADDFVNESDNDYTFDATRYYEPLGTVSNESNAVRKAPFPLVVSARSSGNVARFMNHSCSPNVIWQPVLRENHNESYLHIAFFAIQSIPPMQELTFDYGLVSPEKRERGKKKCLCGSAKCRGYYY